MSDTATEERKRKLQSIREKAGNSKGGESKRIKFRNYQPRDHSLIKAAEASSEVQPSATSQSAETDNEPAVPEGSGTDNPIKKELRQFNSEELNILPKSNNWDIKKFLEPKQEKLRRRTQRAIVDFLREKLNSVTDSESSDEEM
mmetsp:Transcript_1874/g.2982  ORF Transcript_1874/g.2982 Transcript_1874/m.2982 type:complete len:144 (+) Transcript_1874:165-596(+)